MSSHKQACCILEVCCPPIQAVKALAAMIEDAGTSEEAAQEIRAHFDLVPKGVGAALIAGYASMFKDEVNAARGGYATTSEGAPGGRGNPAASGTPDEGA